MSSCSTIATQIIFVLLRDYFLLFNQRLYRGMFLLISCYPTILVIMLAAPVPFFTSHHFHLTHLHYLYDSIPHHPSLICYLGYHLLSIHLILVFLLQQILLMLPPHLAHRIFSTIPDAKDLNAES